jgi:outer membrane lipoprotein carrier protein
MKTVIVALLSVITLNLFAQNDPNAKKILDLVSAKFKTFKTVQANFTLTVTNKAGKSAGSKAGVVYLKGNKYQIQDKGMQIFSDGKKVWKYTPEDKEVTISTVDPTGNSFTIAKLFSNFYDKDFTYKLNGNKKLGTKTLTEIELTPTAKGKNFTKVLLYIDQKQQLIISTKVIETSGNTYTYGMSNLKTNTALSDNLFVFDKSKYPGVEEIEQ